MAETPMLSNFLRISDAFMATLYHPNRILNIMAAIALIISLPGLPACAIIFMSSKPIERQDAVGLLVEIALLAAAGGLSWLAMSLAIRDARHQAATLEAVLQNVADGVLVLDPQGKFVSANPALRRMIPEDRLKEMNTIPLEETIAWRRAVFSVRAAPIHGAGSVVVFRDETRRHETEQARDALLATASHELRTPLGSVMNYLELLLMLVEAGKIDTDQFKEHLQRAIENNRRLLRLVNDMLDHAQLQSGVVKIKQQSFHLSTLLEKTHRSFDKLLKQKQLFYELKIASNVPIEIKGDPKQFQKVLVNVIGNAVKFTGHGGIRVWVALADESSLSIEVTDTGPGIAPEHLPDIFEAFRRASNYARREHQGAGLGLSIAKQIVIGMGGRITVTSTLGVGSTFTISLPLDKSN